MRLRGEWATGIFERWLPQRTSAAIGACLAGGRDLWTVRPVRFAVELAALKRKWASDRGRHPFHQSQISPSCEQFLISV